MTKTDKFLRRFIAQEIVALIERIDATDSVGDSSYHAANHLLREGQLNFIERRLVSNAIKKVARRQTLVGAMNIVVYSNLEGRNYQAEQRETAETYNSIRGGVNSDAVLQRAWVNQLGQQSALQNSANQRGQQSALRNSINPFQ